MTRRYLLLALITLLNCTPPSDTIGKDKKVKTNSKPQITQWRGPERNGVYPETDLLDHWPEGGPQLLWRFDSLGVGYASAAVTEDRIFTVGTHRGISSVFTLDHDGELLWAKPLGPEWIRNYPGSRCTPLIVDSLGYYLSGLGVLYCFHVDNGATRWKKDIMKAYNGRILNCGNSENLVAHGNKIFCTPAGKDSNVVALNRFNGDLIWSSPAAGEESSYGNPILIQHGGRTCFINRTKHSAFSLDAETGETLWAYKLNPKKQANTPIYKDSCLLFIGDFKYDSVRLKLLPTGRSVTPLWSTRELSADQGDVVILGDHVYGADTEQWEFSCVDWQTGRTVYDIHKNCPMLIAVISADGLLYCYNGDGRLFLYKPLENKFEKRGLLDIPDKGPRKKRHHYSHPVIHNRRLYVRHQSSLFAYNIAAPIEPIMQ